jgi:predicted NAD/FAD-binding protein
MERIAIVGTGVAGLGCAWNLRNHASLTLLEKDARPGGHTNTVTVEEDGRTVPIDTGFIVFNKVTYPNLCSLFQELDVPIKPSEMSFSVQHTPTGLEYNGMGVNKVFAQRLNLFRPRFHGLLSHIQRFFRVAKDLLDSPSVEDLTLGEFVKRHGLSQDFLDLYLVPMSSAVWSTEPGDILGFPASTLIRFFHNHGFLGVDTHHPWFTVDGGARTYVEKILGSLGAPRLSAGVTRVEETNDGTVVTTASGETITFDRVVFACHADQALALLAAPDAE